MSPHASVHGAVGAFRDDAVFHAQGAVTPQSSAAPLYHVTTVSSPGFSAMGVRPTSAPSLS